MRLLLFVFCFFSLTHISAIQETSHIEDVFQKVQELDSDALIIFDIDETLTGSENPIFQRPNIIKYRSVYKNAFKDLSQNQRTLLQSLSVISKPSYLIEDQSCQGIDLLQSRGHKVIALTACLSGVFQQVSLPHYRVEELSRLGISFKRNLSHLSSFEFSDLKPLYGNYPIYRDGIVFANGDVNSKGEVLSAFLDIAQLTPSSIVFIDDKVENLLSVEQEMEKREIPILSFHYTRGKKSSHYDIEDEDELVKELLKMVNLTLVTHNQAVQSLLESEL